MAEIYPSPTASIFHIKWAMNGKTIPYLSPLGLIDVHIYRDIYRKKILSFYYKEKVPKALS